MILPGGSSRPAVPPSLFGATSPLFFAQTLQSTPRHVDERNVSTDARSEYARKLEDEMDKIESWNSMVDYCQKKFTPQLLVDTSVEKVLRLVKLTTTSPPSVEFSVIITENYHVEAYKGKQKVPIRDLVEGFHITVQKYSHIDDIVERMRSKETQFDPQAEIRAAGEEIFRISDDITVEEIESWSEAKQRQLRFIGRQLLALGTRHYTVENMKDAIDLYLRSRSSYNAMRKLLVLPNRNTLLNYFGKLGVAGAEEECENTIRRVFSSLDEGQKSCFLSFDEMHILPGYSFQGKYVFGQALNVTEPCPASRMLAIMVNPSFGAPPFVVRLIPVHQLDSKYLYPILKSLIALVHKYGGYVHSLMSDNLSVNRTVFDLFHKEFGSVDIASINHPCPNCKFKKLFTIYDSPHLLKNIRNNWMTENSQTLTFRDPDTNENVIAKWTDLVDIYKEEQEGLLRETKLDYQTLYPNSFEKQKVNLAVNVFNQKTVVALRKRGKLGTAAFVAHVTKMWEIINVKSPRESTKLNDPNRAKIEDEDDPRLNYLHRMATSMKLMDNSIRGKRVNGLTGETSNAVHQTLIGLIDLVKILLNLDHEYVLLGKFQSDRLEKEFGIYRQGSGGNFLIAAEQVINSLQLERLKLFNKLDIRVEKSCENVCCTYDMIDNDEDMEALDECFVGSCDLTPTEKSSLYYIAGYVSQKEDLPGPDIPDDIHLLESEFTVELSRGKLRIPSTELYELAQYYYSFFKARSKKCCTKIFLEAFDMIQQFTLYDLPDVNRINRRFLNCFFKAFVKKENEIARQKKVEMKDKRNTKRRRISSDA